MKVLLTSLYYLPSIGGVENSLKFLAQQFVNLGHEVVVLSFDNNKTSDLEIDEINNIKVYRYSFKKNKVPLINGFNIISATLRISEFIYNEIKPDIIICRNSFVLRGLLKSKLFDKINYIVPTTPKLNIEGLYAGKMNFLSFILKNIDYFSHRRVERINLLSNKINVIVFSDMMRKQLLAEFSVCNNVHVIKPGVNLDFFKPVYHFPYSLKDYQSVLQSKYILYVGRLAKAKNIDILIKSIQYVSNINLVIVGSGPEEILLKNIVNDLGLNHRIHFLGKQLETIPFLYSNAQLSVLPTKIETFGQVLIESLACGAPVVGFGKNDEFRTAIEEIVKYNFNGVIVTDFRAESLAKAIVNFLSSIEEISEVKEKNTEYVKNNFVWSKTVKEILQIN